jgi:dihydroorotase
MTLVHTGKIPLSKLVSKLTAEPARLLSGRHAGLGSLSVGSSADVAVIHPDLDWIVDTADFVSKGKNTPLAGMFLKGKVVMTLAGGEVVYQDKAVIKKDGAGQSRSKRMSGGGAG